MKNDIDFPKTSIIIINWNGKHFLDTCLSSIMKNTLYPSYEVIVVDNGSLDGSVEFIEMNYPAVKIIKNSTNLGFAKANNQAVNKTDGDYIFLLNNDTEVMEGWLSESIMFAQSDPNIGIVGSKIFYMDMKPQYMGDRIIPRHGLIAKLIVKCEEKRDQIKEVDFILGAAFLVKREVFNRIGLFDENFFIYGEEGDFCWRARNVGYRVMYNPYSKVRHYSSGTAGESNISYFNRRRGAVRFYLLNFSIVRLFLQAFFEIPVIVSALVSGRFILLLRAYTENLKDIKEIQNKRKSRKQYTLRSHSFFKIP